MVPIIVRCRLIRYRLAAFGTLVKDGVAIAFHIDANRLHQTTAGGLTVAGVDVDVFAPETVWAVIGIPIADNCRATVLARKVLFVSYERFHNAYFPSIQFSRAYDAAMILQDIDYYVNFHFESNHQYRCI